MLRWFLVGLLGFASTEAPSSDPPDWPEKVPPPDEPPPRCASGGSRTMWSSSTAAVAGCGWCGSSPKNGVPYHLIDTNGDGRLDRADSDLPIRPIYYTIYAWD